MRGLILKDLFAIKKSYIANLLWAILINLYCMMFAIGSVYGNFADMQNFGAFLYVSCFTPIFVSSTLFISFYYDKESKFNEFELILPVPDPKKVLSKYIMAGLCLVSSVFYIIIPILCCLLTNQTVSKLFVFSFLFAMQIMALIICIIIPVNYLFKDEQRAFGLIILVLWVLFAVLAWLYIFFENFAEYINAAGRRIANHLEITAFIMFIIVAVCFWISYRFAIKAYKRKRGGI